MKTIRFEYVVTLVYLILGLLWIFFSDAALTGFSLPAETLSLIQSVKGSFYVVATAFLLLLLVRNYRKKNMRLQDKLQQSAEKYKSLYEFAPLAYQSLDENGVIIDVNPMWLNTLGYERHEVAGREFSDFLQEDFVAHFEQQFPAFKKRGYVHDVRFGMLRKDGKPLIVSFEGCVGLDPNGSFRQTYCTFKDITRETGVMDELRQSEERYRSLFKENSSVMLLIDPQTGDIIDANEAAVDFYGYTLKTLRSMHIGQINILPADEIREKLNLAASGKRYFKFQHKLATGDIRDVEVYSGHININGNTVVYSTIHDITAQTKAEKALGKALDKARESDRLKSAFLANLSHEIRTPMNGILGFSDLLRDDDLTDDEKNRYIQSIHSSGRYLLAIINDIIEMAHLDAGQVKTIINSVDLQYLMRSLGAEVRQSIPAGKDLQLIYDENGNEAEMRIKTDDVKFRQIMVIFLSNAIKYTPRGTVRYGYSIDDGWIKCYVRDTGIGIGKEDQKIVFERFRQGNTGKEVFQSGSGLGLAIANSYARLLGGKISMESVPGEGSVFYFGMPVNVMAQTDVNASTAKAKEIIEDENLKILIAEDDDSNYALLMEIFADMNFNVFRARTGLEAVEICRNNADIQLVLMDIKMPAMNGIEAMKQIRDFRPELVIIAQTAYALANEERNIRALGFNDYLPKPIRREELIRIMNEHSGI